MKIAGLGDKRQITLTFVTTMSGAVLSVEILLYAGKIPSCHPSYTFVANFDIWHMLNHSESAEIT